VVDLVGDDEVAVGVGDGRDDALERRAPAGVHLVLGHPAEDGRHVRVELAVVHDVRAAPEALVAAETRRLDGLHEVRPRVRVERLVVGGSLGVDDEAEQAALERAVQGGSVRLEDLVVPEEAAAVVRDLGDDVAEVAVPALVGRLGPVDGEGVLDGHAGRRLRVVPDVGAAPEAGEVAQAAVADLLDELGPDLGVPPVVLGLGAGEDPEIEDGAIHDWPPDRSHHPAGAGGSRVLTVLQTVPARRDPGRATGINRRGG
jgi:hypothetical protein